MASAPRWFPARFKGRCVCGATFPEGFPSVYDGERKATIRCASCPDLTGAEQREVKRIQEAEIARARAAEEAAERARAAPSDIREYVQQAGPNLGLALPMILAHEGIAESCRTAGIAVSALVSALVHLAQSDASRANCSTASWEAVAVQCAKWGLVPTVQTDTPVYVFCRDTKQGRLVCERTRWGFAAQIARILPDANLSCGWTFAPEAILGSLADRIRRREPNAQEDAAALRASLERRAATLAPEISEALEVIGWYLSGGKGEEPRIITGRDRTVIARLGKAIKEDPSATEEATALLPILRAMLATPTIPAAALAPEQRTALDDYRISLEAQSSGLNPADEALLAALRLPAWHAYSWYLAAGPADERTIEWSPPSFALWQRQPMNPRRLDGVPSVWWARLTFTDGDTRREIGFEIERDRVYERAVAGGHVAISSTGLLVPAKQTAAETPWLLWHGEMGTVKAIRELLKAHPTLLERFAKAGISVEDMEERVIEGEAAPTVGVDHLRRVRQIEEQTHLPDFEPVSEKTAVQQEVGAK